MSEPKKVLHLICSSAWPEGLDRCPVGDTAVLVAGAATGVPEGCEALLLGSGISEDDLFALVFDHDMVLTW